jgi:hypothetical protein
LHSDHHIFVAYVRLNQQETESEMRDRNALALHERSGSIMSRYHIGPISVFVCALILIPTLGNTAPSATVEELLRAIPIAKSEIKPLAGRLSLSPRIGSTLTCQMQGHDIFEQKLLHDKLILRLIGLLEKDLPGLLLQVPFDGDRTFNWGRSILYPEKYRNEPRIKPYIDGILASDELAKKLWSQDLQPRKTIWTDLDVQNFIDKLSKGYLGE